MVYLESSLLRLLSFFKHALVLLNKSIVLEAGLCKRPLLTLRLCKYDILRSSELW